MSRRAVALLLAGVLTILLVFGVAGHSVLSGPVLFGVTSTHGVHRDDLIVVVAWLVGMWCAWRLWRD